MKKSVKNVLLIMGIVICLLSSILVYLYLWGGNYYVFSPYVPSGKLNVTENETCWKITVSDISKPLKKVQTLYILSREKEGNYTQLDAGYLWEIDGKPSYDYNVTWLDKDKNGLLSKGDEFIISKSGGSEGKAEQDDRFVLVYEGMALCEEQLL